MSDTRGVIRGNVRGVTGTAREDQISTARDHLDAKASHIVEKYGPGPRVHYHIGLFDGDGDEPDATSSNALGTTEAGIEGIRLRITRAQHALVRRAARAWSAEEILRPGAEVIDVGTGLGGGAIHWAERYGVIVWAVTNVASHIAHIERFAAEAGVGDLVRPVLSDARDIPAPGRTIDAAVAMESLCYMPRRLVFGRLAELVRPGGWLCVQDVFLRRPRWQPAFDAYWKTSIGTKDEYVAAARDAGFVLDRDEDVSRWTSEFWVQSMAWAEARIVQLEAQWERDAQLHHRLVESLRWHAGFHRAWRDHAIEVRLLRFQRRG
ncbi:methyltransferase [Streptomyces sp. NBRC 110611]|uniref:SAM-dependent methyltransferase n=1 Tax=Streptomyces sp. NBRC 110611 TaxID=1621259 RepID=UPI0008567BC0|nr:class I SAM-dependent methyltransferase [Streptomyces sp. NBRC 110611]GAU70369.1 methyltransferase [Streptomyces sp. NBRC 110611]